MAIGWLCVLGRGDRLGRLSTPWLLAVHILPVFLKKTLSQTAVPVGLAVVCGRSHHDSWAEGLRQRLSDHPT